MSSARITKNNQLSTCLEKISVIVPVRNEKNYIDVTLRRLISQKIPRENLEILVADGRSMDNTKEIVEKYSKRYAFIKLLDNPKKIASAGRNICIEHSTGDFLLIIDGHCDLANLNYLSIILNLFRNTEADCLGRPQPLQGECRTSTQKAIALARGSWIGHNPSSLIFANGNIFSDPSSVAVAYRRISLIKNGLFDERFDACEDVELNFRVCNSNSTCFFSDAIQLNYIPRNNLIGLFRQMKRYGRGRIRLARKHPKAFSKSICIPVALILLLCLTLLSTILFPSVYFLCFGVASVYFFLVAMESATMVAKKKENLVLLLLIPLVTFIVHLGSAVGIMVELLNGMPIMATER